MSCTDQKVHFCKSLIGSVGSPTGKMNLDQDKSPFFILHEEEYLLDSYLKVLFFSSLIWYQWVSISKLETHLQRQTGNKYIMLGRFCGWNVFCFVDGNLENLPWCLIYLQQPYCDGGLSAFTFLVDWTMISRMECLDEMFRSQSPDATLLVYQDCSHMWS